MIRNILIAVATIALTCGLVIGSIDIGRAVQSPEPLVPVLQAFEQFVTLIALAAILAGLLLLPGRSPQSAQVPAELAELLKKLRAAIDQLPTNTPPMSVPPLMDDTNYIVPIATPTSTSPPVSGDTQQLLALLRELRDLTLLSDTQRQDLLAKGHQKRREYFQSEAQRFLQRGLWADVDRVLLEYQSEFPDDVQLESLKDQLDQARQKVEQDALRQLHERIEDLAAIGSWDRARLLASQFVENFPQSPQGAATLEQVNQRAESARDEAANRLYQEIKSNIDHRHWRRALAGAHKLLEQSSGHRRAATIREQLATITQNAEIEERQDLEKQIQELMRNKQFSQAVDLAEQVLERFPDSPQAESLEEMLPKMRQLAIENEIETES